MEENNNQEVPPQDPAPAPEPVCLIDGNVDYDQDGICRVCGWPKPVA